MNYNRNLNRFQRNYQQQEQNFQSSVGALAELFKYNKSKDTGLLGLGQTAKAPQFGSLTEAIDARNKGDAEAAKLVQQAYQGVAPDDWKMATQQFADLNQGQEGSGLLGSVQTIDKALGGYGGAALKKAGSFAMDKLGGEAVKQFGTNMLAKTGLSGLAGSAGAVMGALGPIGGAIGVMQAGKELIDSTVSQYEGLEQGIKSGQVMQQDLSSRSREAKERMFSMNKDIAEIVSERRGLLRDKIGSQAEQVLQMSDRASRSNLEMQSNPMQKNREGLIDAYMDSSNMLSKQMENLRMSNVDAYRRQKQGLIAEGADLQASIDDMQSQKDDMEWQYNTANAVKFW